MGGPDVPGNIAMVCDTGHRSVHVFLAWMLFGEPGGDPEPDCTRTEKAMGRRGHEAWVKSGRPGNPHAAYALHVDA